jgi:IS30 family transposase
MRAHEITLQERVELEKLLKKHPDECMRFYAEKLGRSKSGIVQEIRRGGDKKTYNAIEAQKVCNEISLKKRESLRKLNQTKYLISLTEMKKSILNLEMQLEIVFDLLKGKVL